MCKSLAEMFPLKHLLIYQPLIPYFSTVNLQVAALLISSLSFTSPANEHGTVSAAAWGALLNFEIG